MHPLALLIILRGMSDLTISPVTSATALDAVRRLCWDYRAFLNQASPQARKIVEIFYDTDTYQDLMNRLQDLHAAPGGTIRLALLDGTPVGCGMSHQFNAQTAEIKRLYVSDAARGYGVGRALCLDLAQACRDAGYSKVVLDTVTTLTPARRLYEDLGFRPCPAFYDAPPAADGLLCFYEKHL